MLRELFRRSPDRPRNLAEITNRALSEVKGENIEKNLVALGAIGGTRLDEQPERFATDRLALTENDLRSRDFLRKQMEAAGMKVIEHPLGLIGRYEGKNPKLKSVAMISHTDTVPNGGMYDGTTGVMCAIEAVSALNKQKIKLSHDIVVIALTGEEAARFNMALFGSKGLFHGFTEKELAVQDAHGITLRQALITAAITRGLNPDDFNFTKRASGNPEIEELIANIGKLVEVHVAQSDLVEKNQLAVIEAIASPTRYEVTIGDNALEEDTQNYSDAQYVRLQIHGKAGHSGANPMGATRADGLVAAADIIEDLSQQIPTIAIGNITIEGESINKIPGETEVIIRLSAQDREKLESYIANKNQQLLSTFPNFDQNAITIADINLLEEEKPRFYPAAEMRKRQQAAATLIKEVNRISTDYGKRHVVGTVGTWETTSNGKLKLRVDIRGINRSRNRAIRKIMRSVRKQTSQNNLPHPDFGIPLPGSGKPVQMNKRLVHIAENMLRKRGIPFFTTFSRAGHDAQNAARAGIPTIMMFCASGHSGAAHTPKEFSRQEDLELLARSELELVMQLAA